MSVVALARDLGSTRHSVLHVLGDHLQVVWGALLAFVVVMLLTPAVGGMARLLGAVDTPGGRRLNLRPVPRLGGLALFLGIFVPSLAFLPLGGEMRGVLLGAAVVIVGDLNAERLAQARGFGCETVDVTKGRPEDQIEQILGVPEVDAAVDAVGFEARGHGKDSGQEAPATVLNSIMEVTRAGGKLGIPGLYVTGDPGGVDEAAKVGSLSIRLGLGWAKSHSFATGQCPVMRYHRQLMEAILNDRVQIAKAVNATVLSLDEAPQGYKDFDKGASKKFVLDPHGLVPQAA